MLSRPHIAVSLGLVTLVCLAACGGSPTQPTHPAQPESDLRAVTVTIVGTGSVTSVPSGLSCESGRCSALFPPGWQISLHAGAGGGWSFAGWTGDCQGTTNRCDLTTDVARSATATFAR